MEIFKRRPLLVALFIFLLCSAAAIVLPTNIKHLCCNAAIIVTAVVLLVFSLLAALRKMHLYKLFNIFICFVSFTLALVTSINFFDKELKEIEALGEQTNVIAKIEECTYRAAYTAVYTAKIESIDGESTDFRAEISSDNILELADGERIIADMTFAPFREAEYGFDERNTNISNGIFVSATFSDAEPVNNVKEKFSIVELFNKLRKGISKRIDKSDLEESAPLIKALLIGYQDELDSSVKLNFRRLGITHILSISGSHFTVLLGILTLLLSFIGLNKRVIYAILIPVALFYMGLSGFSFPVCRAGIMSIMTYSTFLFGRERDSYTALFLSTTLIILVSPYSVTSLGMWLSFAATFSIILTVDFLSGSKLLDKNQPWYIKAVCFIINSLIITLSVSFFTLPITAAYFGELSIVAPIANLLIVPLLELYLYIIPFAVIFIDFVPLVELAELWGTSVLTIIDNICNANNLLISVRQNFVLIIAITGIVATLIMVSIPLRRKVLIIIPTVLSVFAIFIGIGVFMNIHSQELHVTYYNTGVSDGVVLVDNNKALCIDVSNGSSSAAYYTEHIADTHYCPEISGYLFTHYHTLHVNQFKKLINRTKVHAVYMPEVFFEDDAEHYDRILEIARENNVKTVGFKYGEPFDFENCTITVFEPQLLKRSSHEPISFEISSEKGDILYLGSSFNETNINFGTYTQNAEYIILGQHHPVPKKEYRIAAEAKMIFGSENVFSLSERKDNATVIKNGDRYDILLK